MARRRKRRFSPAFLFVLLLGVGVAAAGWSVWNRVQPEPVVEGTSELLNLEVEVLNGCGVTGAASRVATLLRRSGCQVVRLGEADHYHYKNDIVVVRRGKRKDAQGILGILKGSEWVEQRSDDAMVDVTIIVGKPHPLVESDVFEDES